MGGTVCQSNSRGWTFSRGNFGTGTKLLVAEKPSFYPTEGAAKNQTHPTLDLAAPIVFIALTDKSGGPDVLIGWPNRFMVVTYSAWLIIAPWLVG